MEPEPRENRHPIYTRYSRHFQERPTVRDKLQSFLDRALDRLPYGRRGDLKFSAQDIFGPKQNP